MADALFKFGKQYGPTVAIALYLVWYVTNANAGVLETISTTLNAHVADSNRLLYRVCLNTAQGNPDLIAGCQEPNRR